MANSVGDRRGLIAIWDAKTSYGAAWRQQSKLGAPKSLLFLAKEIRREESLSSSLTKRTRYLECFKPSSFQ